MDVILLVGGQGTRLRHLVQDRPKAMAMVAGRPFIDWLLLALRARGLRRVILATGYKGEVIESYLHGGTRWGLHIRCAREATPLGTGGALRHAAQYAETERVLVLNGDSLCSFDVDRLAATHALSGAGATLWLVRMDDCRRYGTVIIDRDGRVLAFREKSDTMQSGLISAGVYCFDRTAVADIALGRTISLEIDVFPAMAGRDLYATVGEGPFLDIGTPESLNMADRFIANYRAL